MREEEDVHLGVGQTPKALVFGAQVYGLGCGGIKGLGIGVWVWSVGCWVSGSKASDGHTAAGHAGCPPVFRV